MLEALTDDRELPFEQVKRLRAIVGRVERLALVSLCLTALVAVLIIIYAPRWNTVPEFARTGLPALLLWLIVAATHTLHWLYTSMKVIADATEQMAIIDANTRCFNYRYLMIRLDEEEERCKRYGGCFSLLYVDLDRFKKVNDKYGHPIGNVVLKDIAALLRDGMRKSDIVGRLGGDEFLAILPDTEPVGAAAVADRIRKTVKRYELDMGEDGQVDFVRLSIGIAGYPENGRSVNDVIAAADHAVYDAKEKGGNTVTISREYVSRDSPDAAGVGAGKGDYLNWSS